MAQRRKLDWDKSRACCKVRRKIIAERQIYECCRSVLDEVVASIAEQHGEGEVLSQTILDGCEEWLQRENAYGKLKDLSYFENAVTATWHYTKQERAAWNNFKIFNVLDVAAKQCWQRCFP